MTLCYGWGDTYFRRDGTMVQPVTRTDVARTAVTELADAFAMPSHSGADRDARRDRIVHIVGDYIFQAAQIVGSPPESDERLSEAVYKILDIAARCAGVGDDDDLLDWLGAAEDTARSYLTAL